MCNYSGFQNILFLPDSYLITDKTRITEEPEDGVMSSSPEENTAEPSSTSRTTQDKEQGSSFLIYSM